MSNVPEKSKQRTLNNVLSQSSILAPHGITLLIVLGLTLNRTLTFREHLTKVAATIKTRNNTVNELANTNWGSGPNTLRISSLAPVYSLPVWLNRLNTSEKDT
ncbi:Hypothetical protein CINCED_3A021339 [Cinara cedri]|uniref:Uncharacterized protein n=1 Tax=Cinara cedri TaxID=506608 RepID=A0A5E4NJT6_9HEMI|nr:Hypothetical protein CINCED_3A021339 [Cinara cedri]